MPQKFEKDKDAKLDYSIDYAAWLKGDTLSSSTWEVEEGLTIATPLPSLTPTATTIWLSGGTTGERYQVTNHIVTAAGREDDRTIWVYVTEK
jgi:hypothetical protein